jgi:hypothetical protein
MKLLNFINPFMVAIYPVLFLYNYNLEEVTPNILPAALLICLALAFVIFLVCILALRDTIKASIIACLFLLLFFSFGHIHDFFLTFFNISATNKGVLYILILLSLAVLGMAAYPLAKSRKNLGKISSGITILFLCLLAVNAVPILSYELKRPHLEEIKGKLKPIDPKEGIIAAGLPDIYFIIVDEYASNRVLKEIHNTDNEAFADFLRSKGFIITEQSHANYPQTELSMAASLNMEYLHETDHGGDLTLKPGLNTGNLMTYSKVLNYLKSKGYKTVNFSSGSTATDYMETADYNVVYLGGANEFNLLLAHTTMLRIFDYKQFSLKRLRLKHIFNELCNMTRMPGPKFVLAHIPSPHPPNVFGPSGEEVDSKSTTLQSWQHEPAGYLNEMKYLNKQLIKIIDTLLAAPGKQPLIILQADHGPAFTLGEEQFARAKEITIRERFGIFSAFLVPTECSGFIYDTITPVNDFIPVFNCLFGAGMELLKDKSFWVPYSGGPKVTDVTEIVNKSE